ncbi:MULTISPECIES: hypothetical protein [unclassified Prochlorococcus]|uniref:hypothetical protein n=1 Tax=unclassified Prochlorococcus TaxID=2627481 RepID=UPI0005339BED|nr:MULTISPECIES: hypothetical protein [unclassified Prochlorococcus]KGG14977.1 hypothetical protein EV06_1491 [Prochlorococcus sp. MIT 0602]KGG17186.1 hypothetical protein EV07_0621 [Prochlorococcus sp. MIT 0603]
MHKIKKAWLLRQKDTGWGYACGHALPPIISIFIAIFYAVTRKTITPLLLTFSLNLLLTPPRIILFLAASGSDDPQVQQGLSGIAVLLFLIKFIATANIAKFGIRKARLFAKQKLGEVVG